MRRTGGIGPEHARCPRPGWITRMRSARHPPRHQVVPGALADGLKVGPPVAPRDRALGEPDRGGHRPGRFLERGACRRDAAPARRTGGRSGRPGRAGSLLMSSTTTSGRSCARARPDGARPRRARSCSCPPPAVTSMPSTISTRRRARASRSRPAAPGARGPRAAGRSRRGGSPRRPPADSAVQPVDDEDVHSRRGCGRSGRARRSRTPASCAPAEPLAQPDRLVDDDLGRRVWPALQLVDAEPEDVPLHDADALEPPVVGGALDQRDRASPALASTPWPAPPPRRAPAARARSGARARPRPRRRAPARR